jgi:hypothetical protein
MNKQKKAVKTTRKKSKNNAENGDVALFLVCEEVEERNEDRILPRE